MKKIFPFLGTYITIIALMGLIYTASSIFAYSCSAPGRDAMTASATVCNEPEAANWAGIAVSLGALAFGIILTARNQGVQKAK